MRHLMVKIFVMCLASLSSTMIFAQEVLHVDDGKDFSAFKVNGLEIGDYTRRYSESDILEAFGQPDSVVCSDIGVMYYFSRSVDGSPIVSDQESSSKRVKSVSLSFLPSESAGMTGPIASIDIRDRESCSVNDFIRVGDDVDKVKQMGGKWKDYPLNSSGIIKGEIVWCPEGQSDSDWICCPGFYYDEERKIVQIYIFVY
ncbi:MAG: hypothetical protein IAB81_05980 [Bacteroidetes bacterium]|uniref:Uncharacterized protein n=1 Tax=Candidatus Merdivivens pullicola TaxID=2840872 RepID=A0A9D9NH10_9BACT|nr:hypothetical protein [Candidatus Merdivivens pullicola]